MTTVTTPPEPALDAITRVGRPLALAALALIAAFTVVGLVIMNGLEDSVVQWDLDVEQELVERRTPTMTG